MNSITQAILRSSIHQTMEWYELGYMTKGEALLRLDLINRNLHGRN